MKSVESQLWGRELFLCLQNEQNPEETCAAIAGRRNFRIRSDI